MLDYISRLLKVNSDKKREKILSDMADYKMISPYSGDEADLFIMFGSYLYYNAVGILLRIPYLKLLKNVVVWNYGEK